MKYYEMHEAVYLEKLKRGELTWDGETSMQEVLNYDLNNRIEKDFNLFVKNKDSALDLGTGTGVCALKLKQLGVKKVTGVDVSQTAIKLAAKNASELKLDVKFLVNDVTTLSLSMKYDFVIDSNCLHCIVQRKDRDNFFNVIQDHLKDQGVVYLNTMTQSEGMHFGDNFLLEDSTLYSKNPRNWNIKTVMKGNEPYFPHRKILTIEEQIKEVQSFGFTILKQEVFSSNKNPHSLSLWLKRT